MKILYLTTSLTILTMALTTTSAAQPKTETENSIETTLITATRTEQTLDSTLAPVNVFTRDDIEKLQAKTLEELFIRVPGINFSSSGNKGSVSSLYIRGTNDSHALFLIDGQRINSATAGSASFQFINPEMIERVEVVRGPRSSIYGSDAIGGVIQIFTKKGSDQPGHYARIGAGSHNAQEIAAGSRGEKKQFHYAVNASYYDTDGIDSLENDTPPSDDNDAYRNTSTSFNMGYTSKYIGVFDLNFYQTKTKTDYDSTGIQPYRNNWLQSTSFSYRSTTVGPWSTRVLTGRAIDDSDNYDDLDPHYNTNFRTTRDSFSWINELELPANQYLTIGYDYYQDNVDASTPYLDLNGSAIDSRDRNALFTVYQAAFGDSDLQLGLREDDDEDFGTETTANAALGYALGSDHKIILSYGEGFKAPTFNDLYYTDDFGNIGNPNLKAETSESYEVEFRGNYSDLNWNLNVYKTNISNLIVWVFLPPYTPINVSDADIEGIDLAINTNIFDWSITAALTHVEAEDDATGKQLINRPKNSLSLDLDRNYGDWQVGFTVLASESRYGDPKNSAEKELAGYGIVNARIAYQITDELKAQLKLNNLFDKDYQINYGFNSPYNTDGFNAFVTLTYSL